MNRWLHPPFFGVRVLAAGVLTVAAMPAITPADLAARLARRDNILVIDVRPAQAYGEGHIPGAINIPLALLPHKPLPNGPLYLIYTDGLGAVSDREALAALRARPGVIADALVGGYAAWVAETRLSTRPPGVTREKLPGITYQQLLAADKDDLVLLDLRVASAAATTVPALIDGRRVAAAKAPDTLVAFAEKLGVPVVSAEPATAAAASTGGSDGSAATSSAPRRVSLPVGAGEKGTRLYVLVADDEASANEAARQLRAGGHHRFTILIGGMEIIRHEGRLGSGRLDGNASAVQKQQ